MFPIVPDVISHVHAGTLRPLALASPKPSSVLINVPTMPQLGYPGLTASAWVGLYACENGKLHRRPLRQDLSTLLGSPPFVDRMKQVGIEIHAMSGDEFASFMRAERQRWEEVVKRLQLKID